MLHKPMCMLGRVLILAAALVLSAQASDGAPSGQRTQDGTTVVGRVKGGFRIAAYGKALTMTAPPGWRVLLCTELPLDAHVVCNAPDGKQAASINLWDASRAAAVTHSAKQATPEAYLRSLRRSRDPDIQMRRDGEIKLANGRRVPVWRFHSNYWGERLYVTVPAGATVVSVEVGATSAGLPLRETLRTLLESYRPNQAMD